MVNIRKNKPKVSFAKDVREHTRQDADWIKVIGQRVVDTSRSKVKETTDYTINTLNEGGKVGRNFPPLIVILHNFTY